MDKSTTVDKSSVPEYLIRIFKQVFIQDREL